MGNLRSISANSIRNTVPSLHSPIYGADQCSFSVIRTSHSVYVVSVQRESSGYLAGRLIYSKTAMYPAGC